MRSTTPFLATTLFVGASALGFFAAVGQETPQDARKVEELSADHSLACVVDREGVATVRPATSERSLCADAHDRLFTGDWLATGARGANALSVRLKSGDTLILGPGAQVELVDATHLQVLSGEVEIGASEKSPLTVAGPGGASVTANGKKVVRARGGKFETLDAEPTWLSGYKAGQSTEALGSLLANVDGRNVPLTLGYHTVHVDVRDQIARTVVEESFVNHTDHVLEGVFYFPLPADASISSFGMWIGDELVEGDIVEKEKARAIYEQILREKRDPGLLEWSGGNVFKARVYPISGEKRVKIAYTQVLPKTGDTWAYHYALQSELLRLHPLSKLSIDVKVSSAEPLAAVASPSHTCRTRMTEHSASVEFEASEYTPDRDFELRVATKPSSGALTFVSDVRAGDGYFLARFRAPAADAAARAAAEKQPIDLAILADTSGSMAGAARETQVQFVEALLATLGPNDTFQLATCDVETRLAFVSPVANTAENREAALRFLEERGALGWSDLATGFKTLLTSAKAKTQIVYVGDAIPTLGDADPGAFANKVPGFYEGRGAVHVVVPGNTSEPLVVRALSHLGGGTIRSIGGGTDPTQTASALLSEIAAPSARDLKLVVDGITAAAVYPEELPNLCEGREQVIVGRYDVHGGKKGTVKVTGTFNGKPVESTSEVSVAESGESQSFIPRLWARHHLDHLLTQGPSAQNKARIVALSEDFQIATPYTSFLVLESDADRERFAVQKRMRMRDGEEFFAKGRSDATFELVRQQMQLATQWHRALRADLLRSLTSMDRGLMEGLRNWSPVTELESRTTAFGVLGGSGGFPYGGGGGGRGKDGQLDWEGKQRFHGAAGEKSQVRNDYFGDAGGETGRLKKLGYDAGEPTGAPTGAPASGDDELDAASNEEGKSKEARLDDLADEPPEELATAGKRDARRELSGKNAPAAPAVSRLTEGLARDLDGYGFTTNARQQLGRILSYDNYQQRVDWDDRSRGPDRLDSLLPPLADPRDPVALDVPWPDEVKALIRSLERRALLETTALHVSSSSTTTDRRERVSPAVEADWLLSKDAWRTVSSHARGDFYFVEWLRGGKRGVWRADRMLGRVRDAKPNDATSTDLPIPWTHAGDWTGLRDYVPTLKDLGDGKVELTLTHPARTNNPLVVTIDRKRAVVLEATWRSDPPQGTNRFSDFVEVAGATFPTTITTLDAKGRVVALQKLTIEALAPADFATKIDAELATRSQLIELGPPPKDLDTAKQHAAKNEATLEDLWLLLVDASVRGEIDEAQTRFAALEKRMAGRYGLTPISLSVLSIGRRHEELRVALLAQAKLLVEKARDPELTIAEELLAYAAPLGLGQETLELLRALEPVWRRHAERRDHLLQFEQQVINHTAAMQRPEETAALQQKAAKDWPDVVWVQTAWADAQAQLGEIDAAVAWLDQVEKANGPWEPGELDQLQNERQGLLWNGYRLEDLVARIDARLREAPDAVNPTGLDMYLSALLMLDREANWSATVQKWLDEGKVEKPSEGASRRVEVALRHALGQGFAFNGWNHRFTSEESKRLEEAARAFLQHEASYGWALQIVTWNSFRDTPAARAIVAEVFASAEKGVESLAAAELARELSLARSGAHGDEQTPERWKKLEERVLARWKAATDPAERTILEGILASAGRAELMLAVWRTKLERATTPLERRVAAQQVLALRLAGEWSAEAQAEALVMAAEVAKITAGAAPAEDNLRKTQRVDAILAWYDLVNWMVEARVAHDVAATPDVNNLPRRKLASLRDELRKTARLATRELVAARESVVRSAAANPPPAELPFLELDRIWLDVLLKQKVDAACGDALALLDSLIESTKGTKPEELDPTAALAASRCTATLLHQIAGHEDELAKRFAAGLETNHPLLDWKALEMARLIVLDRGDELEKRLAEWYAGGDDFTKLRFGRDLAHLRAERNKLDEAAALFEAIAKIDPLPHADCMTLAGWYTALGRKEDAARAKLSAWAALDENRLGQFLNQARWKANQNDGRTTIVDDDVPDQIVALMRKAQWPANWSWQLQNLYAPTKDFRLLQCLPEAVLGHTAQGIYPFLTAMVGFDKLVDEEATVDRIVAHIGTVAPRAKTGTDRRALALLQFIAQYKAAAQRNGGAPHAEKALPALKAAFERDWADGEERLYAALLQSFGPFADRSLRDEQLRQVRELSGRVKPGGADRLAIVDSLAFLLWNSNDHDGALAALGAELNAQRSAHGGRLPDHANDALVHYVSWLQSSGDWLAAERCITDELKLAPNAARVSWLENQLFQGYAAALRAGGTTSLGRGRELYAAAQKLLLKRLATRTDEGRANQQIQALVALWNAAKATSTGSFADDATRFAFDGLPAALQLYQYRGGQQMVAAVANALRELAGAATAVDLLVTRAENEPRWLARSGQTLWDQEGWMLANFRHEAGRMDERIERRLLNLVVKELKEDLRAGNQRARGLYDSRWNTWWSDKRRDFSDAAHELLGEVGDDEGAVVRVADYLHEGLKQFDDGIAVLLERKKQGRLSFDPQATLVTWLQKRERWSESLPLAAELVIKRPDDLDDRVHHLLALAKTKQKDALQGALDATVAHWHELKAWNEPVVAALAESCLDTGLAEKSAAWFDEAIQLHVKANANRGVGDGVLASYYTKRSSALADLGRTADAVDSAAGAVIAWGADQNSRNIALAALRSVLVHAEDLDGYVAKLDAEVKKSGLENPTIRRVLGSVYVERSAWAKAADQLKEALSVQPNDPETQRALVNVYDRMKRPELAVAQLFAALEVTNHDVALTKELGERLVKLGDAARAERVHTNLVETMAQESESHEALARVRENQQRLPEAAEQWQQVIRIRSQEPTGYLGLARVLVRQKDRKGAVEVLQKVLGGDWEKRFGDVKAEARSLLKQAGERAE